jgi:hypothetical protein
MIPTTPSKDETMLKEGAAKLAARHEAQRSAVAKVVPISERVKSSSAGASSARGE